MRKKINFAKNSVFGFWTGLMLLTFVKVQAVNFNPFPSGPRTLPARGTPW